MRTGGVDFVIRSDPARTARRLAALDAYFRRAVLEGKAFRCQHRAVCRRSHPGILLEGQLHHVGAQFDLFLNDVPCRIVVVGQEYGHGPEAVSLAARRAMLRAVAADRRFKADADHPGRNPHMRATTSLLRLLLGRGLGSDYAGEFVTIAGTSVPVFEAFALANFLLCSAVGAPDGEAFRGGQRGRSTRVMREACAEHFRAALTLLQPTILIAQGRAVRRWLGTVLDEVEPVPGTLPLERVRIGDERAVLASFVHPSAPTRDNWGTNDRQRYLRDTVTPTIAALQIAAGMLPA
jgi:hypothetical protein